MTDTNPAPQTIELWLRSFSPQTADSTQTRVLERVQRLEACDVVDRIDLHVWGETFELSALSTRVPHLDRVRSRLESFETWATANDRRLEPCFRRRQTQCQFTGESRDIWHLPTIALAEFDGDDLVHVAPCRDEDRTIDVLDRLDALESRTAAETVVRFDDDPGDHQSAAESAESDAFESVGDGSTPADSSSSSSVSSSSSSSSSSRPSRPSSESPPPGSN